MTTDEVIGRLRGRRAALWEQGKTFTTAAARAAIAREIRGLDAQIAAYEAAAERLAELDDLARKLTGQAALAQRLEHDGVEWQTLFAQLRARRAGRDPLVRRRHPRCWAGCAAGWREAAARPQPSRT